MPSKLLILCFGCVTHIRRSNTFRYTRVCVCIYPDGIVFRTHPANSARDCSMTNGNRHTHTFSMRATPRQLSHSVSHLVVQAPLCHSVTNIHLCICLRFSNGPLPRVQTCSGFMGARTRTAGKRAAISCNITHPSRKIPD